MSGIIKAIKAGKMSYKNDDTGNVHLKIGKVSFEKEKILANLREAIASIKKNKPSQAKGVYLKRVFLSTTMGPSIPLNLESFA